MGKRIVWERKRISTYFMMYLRAMSTVNFRQRCISSVGITFLVDGLVEKWNDVMLHGVRVRFGGELGCGRRWTSSYPGRFVTLRVMFHGNRSVLVGVLIDGIRAQLTYITVLINGLGRYRNIGQLQCII